MSIRSLLFLCVLVCPATGFGESLSTLAETRKLADKAVGLFREEKITEAYGVLKPYWPLAPVEIDSLANQTTTQWPLVTQRFGSSLGTEFIRERKAGESFVQYIYLQKFERHAIRWLLVFYKAQDRWVINSVSFDDSIGALF
jgi:hypothetical protein